MEPDNFDPAVVRTLLLTHVPTSALALVDKRYAKEVRKIRSLMTPLTHGEIYDVVMYDVPGKVGWHSVWKSEGMTATYLGTRKVLVHINPETGRLWTGVQEDGGIDYLSIALHEGEILLDYYTTARVLLARPDLSRALASDSVAQGIFVGEIMRKFREDCNELADYPGLILLWMVVNLEVLEDEPYLKVKDMANMVSRAPSEYVTENINATKPTLEAYLESALWDLVSFSN